MRKKKHPKYAKVKNMLEKGATVREITKKLNVSNDLVALVKKDISNNVVTNTITKIATAIKDNDTQILPNSTLKVSDKIKNQLITVFMNELNKLVGGDKDEGVNKEVQHLIKYKNVNGKQIAYKEQTMEKITSPGDNLKLIQGLILALGKESYLFNQSLDLKEVNDDLNILGEKLAKLKLTEELKKNY